METNNKVIYGGSIYTMEEKTPQSVEAVAVKDDRIVFAGSKDEAIKALGGNAQMIDLKGKTMIPGVIDPHLHHPLVGIFYLCNPIIRADEDWGVPGIKNEQVFEHDKYLSKLTEAEAKIKDPNEWMFAYGYADYYHGQIGRKDLDKISLTRPIMLYHRDTHEMYLNSKALKDTGLTPENTQHDPNIDFERGAFVEGAFFRYIAPKLLGFLMVGDRWERALKSSLEYMHSNGITTVADMLAFECFTNDQDQIKRFRSVIDASDVPLRTYMVAEPRYVFEKYGKDAAIKFIEDQPKKDGVNLKYLKHAKLFSDGGFFAQKMRIKGGYTDGHQGLWITPPEKLKEIAGVFWNKGYPMHVHVNGDEGLDLLLSIYGDLKKANPNSKSRVCFHHLGYAWPEQIKKIKELGFCVQLQPYYVYALGDIYSKHGFEPKKAEYFSRANTCLKNGITIAFHSDFPMAPSHPLSNAWVAVNRIGQLSGKVLGPEERIPVYEALRAITIGAAYTLSLEDEIGSIKAGKKADFTILAEDPLKVDPIRLRDIKVSGKVFNGKYYELNNK